MAKTYFLDKKTLVNNVSASVKMDNPLNLKEYIEKVVDESDGFDSIKIDAITEKTADSGVSVEGVAFKDNVISNVYSNVLSGDALDTAGAVTLTAAQSGSTILVDRAAGLAFTLPTDALGISYKFILPISVTSNAFSVTGAATSDLFLGGVSIVDSDTADSIAFFAPDGSDDDAMICNADTKGRLAGGYVTFTCIANNRWFVDGVLQGDGTLATPFA